MQRTLFDNPPTIRRYRLSDPDTSKEAALAIAGVAKTQMDEVVELVRKYPGLTSAELAERGGIDRYVCGRRLPESRTLELVRNGPAKVCSITGKRALTWWAV